MKDTAKIIVLAGLWKRAFAFLFDMVCAAALTAILYFSAVFPFVSDAEAQRENATILNSRRLESGLYADFDGRAVDPLSFPEIDDVDSFYGVEVTYNGESQEIKLLDWLYVYWTEDALEFGNPLVDPDEFASSILDTQSTGSIESVYLNEDGELRVEYEEGEELAAYTELYAAYNEALNSLSKDPLISDVNRAMNEDAYIALLWVIPPLLGSLAVFYLAVPLCFSDGQTFGKKIFKMVVLTKLGYYYSRPKRVWRFFAFVLELAGILLTFGALLLISYTMTMFTKKHRSIHDYLAGSVVAKEDESLWFFDPAEEEEYNERQRRKKQMGE